MKTTYLLETMLEKFVQILGVWKTLIQRLGSGKTYTKTGAGKCSYKDGSSSSLASWGALQDSWRHPWPRGQFREKLSMKKTLSSLDETLFTWKYTFSLELSLLTLYISLCAFLVTDYWQLARRAKQTDEALQVVRGKWVDLLNGATVGKGTGWMGQ